jgi:hypothetical protein
MDTIAICAVLWMHLGHEDFRVREQAERGLAALGQLAAAHVQVGRQSADPEVRQRCDRLWERLDLGPLWGIDIAELPWLDALPGAAADGLIGRYLVYPDAAADWYGYKYATWLWLVDEWRQGRDGPALGKQLELMRDRAEHWRRHGRYP